MLIDKLEEYSKEGVYPFHMPGHKRQGITMPEPVSIDITEIEGFDDLHHPREILREEQERIAGIYHSSRSYILVNGSSCGNICGIFDACNCNDKIIIGRNAHKSVYHGAILRRLQVAYVTPQVTEENVATIVGVAGYRQVMDENPDAKAIMVTSPTYEGFVEPLQEIVELAHSRKMAVIVDAAHGAHLGFHSYFPENPVESGADYVIMSLHKTLPAMTQTAVIHVNASETRIEDYLHMFQTSSPSYVLMGSVSKCMNFLEEKPDIFEEYAKKLEEFYRNTRDLKALSIWPVSGDENICLARDPSKIVIGCNGYITGPQLAKTLRQDYKIETEMSSFDYVLAMTSVMDTEEGFHRLNEALHELDKTFITEKGLKNVDRSQQQPKSRGIVYGKKVMEMYEAKDRQIQQIAIDDMENVLGKVCGSIVAIYPPGIPICVPGEEIGSAQLNLIKDAMAAGLTVTGLAEDKYLEVVN
ncbi:MAG: aminotransferase class V-fold PLP-dependent enzyme [Lachnospiraceae bacterium]|nr:aminotransferase class V-fold PLP-dependent enzyme [Lachnospiraceae bacterium]